MHAHTTGREELRALARKRFAALVVALLAILGASQIASCTPYYYGSSGRYYGYPRTYTNYGGYGYGVGYGYSYPYGYGYGPYYGRGYYDRGYYNPAPVIVNPRPTVVVQPRPTPPPVIVRPAPVRVQPAPPPSVIVRPR